MRQIFWKYVQKLRLKKEVSHGFGYSVISARRQQHMVDFLVDEWVQSSVKEHDD